MKLLEGKTILVTGAAGGLGRAHARLFAELGARLYLNDAGCDVEGEGSSEESLVALVQEIQSTGGEAVADTSDLSEAGATRALVERAVEHFGQLGAAVGSAGIRRDRSLLKMRPEDLEMMWAVHVRSSFELVQAAAEHMSRPVEGRTGGAILLTTAPMAFFGSARQSNLAATSAAVVGLVRSAAVELRRYGVRVNAIAPTARTRQTEDLPLFRGIASDSMSPEHVAQLAAFLVSDGAAEVHGEILGVAGSRLYTFQSRETTGAFADAGIFLHDAVEAAWAEITRS